MSDYLDNLFNNGDKNNTPITAAIGFNDGANKGFWRIQPRVKFGEDRGQWIEMGAEIRSALKVAGKVVGVTGRAVGSTGNPDNVRMMIQGMSDMGIPDGMYEVSTRHIELIGASIPDEYLRSKGINPEATQDPFGSLLAQSDIPNIEDVDFAPITPDDLRLANDGVNTPEGREQAAFKETPEGKAVAALPEGAANVATPSEVAQMLTPDAEGLPENNASSARARWKTNERLTNGDAGYLASDEGLAAMKDILNEGAAKNPNFYRPALEAIDDPNTSGAEKLQAVADALAVRGSNPDGSKVSLMDANPDRELLLSAGQALEKSLLRAGFENLNSDMYRRSEARRSGMPSPDAEGLKNLTAPGEWTPDPTEEGGVMILMPDRSQLFASETGYSIVDTAGYSVSFGAQAKEAAYGLEGNKQAAIEAYYKSGGAEGLQHSVQRAESLFGVTKEDAGDALISARGRKGEFSILWGPNEESRTAQIRKVSSDDLVRFRGGDVEGGSALGRAIEKGHSFYVESRNPWGSDAYEDFGPDESDASFRTWEEAAAWAKDDVLSSIKPYVSPLRKEESKIVDDAVQEAFDGGDPGTIDELVNALKRTRAAKNRPDQEAIAEEEKEEEEVVEPTDADLLDEEITPEVDELVGPEVDTSDFSRPVKSKETVDESRIAPGDFVNNPTNGDLMRIDDVSTQDDGTNLFSGTDADGVYQEFFTTPGQSLRKTNFAEPGEAPAAQRVAPVSPDTLEPAEIVPKEATVPDNAIDAEGFDVGDRVWDNSGVEVGTVKKILEKGYDNFGRDYTKAQVEGPDGKLSTAKLHHNDPEFPQYGFKKVPKPEKPVAPEQPIAPTEPAAIPEPETIEVPEPAVAPPPPPPGPPGGPTPGPGGQEPPEGPDDLTPPTKKAEELEVGDKIYSSNGTSGTITGISNNNGKITVDYIDGNGEAKSKRFLEGKDVDTKPVLLGPDREASGTPATDLQKEIIADLDDMDSSNPIEDDDLRDRLASAFNDIQDDNPLDEGELQDLIDEVNAYYMSKMAPAAPVLTANRGDHGRNIAPTTKSDEELRATKIKKTKGVEDPDAIMDQLTKDYPDGFFLDDPADVYNGGYMTHRSDIDGGASRHEVIVIRTTGNQFLTVHRFTPLKNGEPSGPSVDYISHDYRDSYSGIHGVRNGIGIMSRFFNGKASPVAVGSREYKAYFLPGGSWQNKLGYWRGKFDKTGRPLSKLKAKQLDELKNKYGGDLDAMNRAHTIEDMRMLTLEEKFFLAANGEAELLNTTTAIQLGQKQRALVADFFDASIRGDRQTANLRYQEMMNLLPENDEAKKIFAKVIREGLKERLDRTGITGKPRTRALQVQSAAVTNYIRSANKKYSMDNVMKLPHVNGGGVAVVKEGNVVEYTDNMGNKVVGRVVRLKRRSGANGYNDYAILQFLGTDGKLHTVNSDLVAAHMRFVDQDTPLTPYSGWARLAKLTRERLGEQAEIRRGDARVRRGMFWDGKTSTRIGLAYLGSDGERPEDSDGSFLVPGGQTKAASTLGSGDTVYDSDGNPIGTVLKVKFTTKNGKPIVAVQFEDADGNKKAIAFDPDEEIGPSGPKA